MGPKQTLQEDKRHRNRNKNQKTKILRAHGKNRIREYNSVGGYVKRMREEKEKKPRYLWKIKKNGRVLRGRRKGSKETQKWWEYIRIREKRKWKVMIFAESFRESDIVNGLYAYNINEIISYGRKRHSFETRFNIFFVR